MQISSYEPSLFCLSLVKREVGGSKLISSNYVEVFNFYTGMKIIIGKRADIHTEMHICCCQDRQFSLFMKLKNFSFNLNFSFLKVYAIHLRQGLNGQ